MAKKPKKLLFTLILIGLLTGGVGCYDSLESRDEDSSAAAADAGSSGDADADTDTDADTDADADSDADTDADIDADTDADTDEELCNDWGGDTYEVPSPPDGLPPNPDELCAADTYVAESNKAAEVRLETDSDDAYRVSGQIDLAAGIAERILGFPEIEVIEAYPEDLAEATVTDIVKVGDGFSFHLEFPTAAWLDPGTSELVVKVTFELICTDNSGDTRLVESLTFLHLCDGESFPIWVSSGGECTVCSEVCEKIASPLPASRHTGPAALSGSPRAEIVPVAHFGRSLVLFAEHRDTEGPLSFRWRASSGTITSDDQAGVIWDVPTDPGPHLIQVAVRDSTSAVVAALNWRHKA